MKCYKCGQELVDGQLFCTQCGAEQGAGATTVLDATNNPYAQPTYEQPTTPLYEQPAAPAYEQPAAPVYAQPAAPAYTQPAAPQQPVGTRPVAQHPTNRGMLKMIFLGLITFGIYPMVIYCRIVTELNVLASRYDGRRTMPYFAMVMFTPFTLGIVSLVWMHNMCERIGNELNRRGCNYKFSASTFWLWNVLGSLIAIGPFVFLHKLMKAMNLLNADFNLNG